MSRKLRLGIDVGGTFTDVVALDAQTREIVARVKVPTTHSAPEGVAAGIVSGIETILTHDGVDADSVAFIAHSTTQATNALLEGDVASTGVLGLLDGLAPIARAQMRFSPVQLAPGVFLPVRFGFARASGDEGIDAAIDALAHGGAESIAVSRAFAADRPDREEFAVARARERGLYATSGHEVSSMYGLRARTRTAALNAAMLPKMVKTARMTAGATRAASISAPLMVMRSDGGVMDVREMERRPILTLLSGPAAGVAGALLHENVTDGIFIEVGGTSSDCSAIRAGMPQMRPARVGGHRTMLRTLDVRTLAVAGGSLPRMRGSQIVDAGPRSAHIAGCAYASFVLPQALQGARAVRIAPAPRDPGDYVVLETESGSRIAVTPTCAANLLGYVPPDAFARGNAESALAAFRIVARDCGGDAERIARDLLEAACAKLIAEIEELIAGYGLDRRTLALVGGGGGAAALVPFSAERAKLRFRLARDAEVISPAGVALALVRETVERSIVDPKPDDILRVRRAAQDAVVSAGASPQKVQVAVEIDTQRNVVRAIASGATEIAEASAREALSEEQLVGIAAALCGARETEISIVARLPMLVVTFRDAPGGGISRVLDRNGVGRLVLRAAHCRQTTARDAIGVLQNTLEETTAFGDVGRALPQLYVLHGARIADFSGLASAEQIVALVEEELAGRDAAEPIVVLAASRPA